RARDVRERAAVRPDVVRDHGRVGRDVERVENGRVLGADHVGRVGRRDADGAVIDAARLPVGEKEDRDLARGELAVRQRLIRDRRALAYRNAREARDGERLAFVGHADRDVARPRVGDVRGETRAVRLAFEREIDGVVVATDGALVVRRGLTRGYAQT